MALPSARSGKKRALPRAELEAELRRLESEVEALVARAEGNGLELVSEMVALACDSLAERALVPAFV